MADKEIKFKITGDAADAEKALKSVGDAADKSGGKLDGLGKIAGGVLTADLMKGAATAAIDFGKDSVAAFRDAEASQRKLDDAFQRFPALAGSNATALRELNAALQEKTGADADDVAAGQATLAQYGLTEDQLRQMTPLLVDYAAKTGKDMKSASEDLGKAMLGQGRALKDVGIDFKDTGTTAGNFAQVMGGLQSQVGGFAESEASTLDGKLQILQTKFGDVQEAIGARLLPVLTQLADAGLKAIDWASQNSAVLIPLVTIVGSLVGVIGTVIGVSKAWAIAQAALNIVMSANPIALVVIAIAALAAGLIYAYQNSETFRNVVNTAFEAIGAAGAWLWNNALQPVIRFLVEGFAAVARGVANFLDGLSNIPGFGWAKDAATAMRGAADQADALAQSITKIPDKTVSVKVVTSYTQTGTPPSAGGNMLVGPIATYAVGGRPRPGELAMFGEQGPELWIPDTSGTVLTAAQTKRALAGPSAVGMGGSSGPTYLTFVDADGALIGRMRGVVDQSQRGLWDRSVAGVR